MHGSGERDRLTGERVTLHKRKLTLLTDEQLLESYAMESVTRIAKERER
jgi:hypothetical protein